MIVDQFGNTMSRAGDGLYDVSDRLTAAMWERALLDEINRPGMFDGPRVVDEFGNPVTSSARGARSGVFFGIRVLDGAIGVIKS